MCSLGIEPTTFRSADTMFYHWATQEHLSSPFTFLLYSFLLQTLCFLSFLVPALFSFLPTVYFFLLPCNFFFLLFFFLLVLFFFLPHATLYSLSICPSCLPSFCHTFVFLPSLLNAPFFLSLYCWQCGTWEGNEVSATLTTTAMGLPGHVLACRPSFSIHSRLEASVQLDKIRETASSSQICFVNI